MIKFNPGPPFEEYYRKKKESAQLKNKEALSKDPLIDKKAASYYNRISWISVKYPLLDSYIKYCKDQLAADDTNTAILYVKDDMRQSTNTEGAQIEYMKTYFSKILNNSYASGDQIQKLSNSGKGALYISKGNITSIRPSGTVKSIDFKIQYNFREKCCMFYGTLKFTENSGGHQDNQFNDVQETNREFVKIEDPNIYTLSVLDGKYYTSGNEKKINQINRYYQTERNKAMKCDKVGEYLIESIIKWIKYTFREETDPNVVKEITAEQLRLRKL